MIYCAYNSFIINIRNYLLFRYVHSYQSYLWNHAASRRVQKYGTPSFIVFFIEKYLLLYLSQWLRALLFVFFRIWYFDRSNRVLYKYICWLIPPSAGSDQVVLGDLVHCKEEHSGKVTEEKVNAFFNTNFEDDIGNDTYDCSHLDDISITTAAEVKSTLVKVSILYLSCISLSTN